MKSAHSPIYLVAALLLLSFALSGSTCGGSSGSPLETEESPCRITIQITSPSNGATFVSGEMVTYRVEFDDTCFSEVFTVKWNSDIDGDIWTEEIAGTNTGLEVHEFSSSALSVGTHVITCTVTDTNEQSNSESITITIEEQEIIYTPFTRSSISFNTVNWLERTGMTGEFISNGNNLSDRGHQGIFTGNTYTLDYETIDFYSQVRTIIEITIVLNDSHDAVESVDFYRTEDDEDVASYYVLSEHFSASNIPRISSSSGRLVFRLDGMGVCNAIQEYVYVQVKNVNFQRRESIDHCEENSWLQVVLFQ